MGESPQSALVVGWIQPRPRVSIVRWNLKAAEGPTIVEDANYDVGKIKEQLDKGDAVDVYSDTLTGQDFRFTTHGDNLYCIAFGWPEDGVFRIRTLRENGPFKKSVQRVTMLGDGAPLVFICDSETMKVTAPQRKPCSCAYVMKIDGQCHPALQ